MLSKFKIVFAAAALAVASTGANALSYEITGNAQNITGNNFVLSTAVGEETGDPVSADALEVFAGLAAGALDALGTADAGDGSAVKGTVNVKAGETFSFDWAWLTTDFLPFDDFAFVALSDDTLEAFVSVSSLGDLGAGTGSWVSDVFDVDTKLSWVIGIVDGGDENQESRLNITNLSPVPVPAAALLFGSALLGFAGFSARRKIS